MNLNRRRKGIYLMSAVLFAAMLAGCGASNSKSGAYYAENEASYDSYGEDYATDEIYMPQSDTAASGTGSANEQGSVRAGRKLIKTANFSVETLQFDDLLVHVQDKTEELGGYVESMNVYNGSAYNRYNYSYYDTGYRNDRSASLTLRIPSENMDAFLTYVGENSNVTNRSVQEVDVTLDYVDLESHKKTLLAEQDRLLELMGQAETLEDIITLESRLSEIRYQSESMESRLRTYDNQITYSTLYLDISEVVELTPVQTEEKTVWERIGEGFVKSLTDIGNGCKEFFVWFVVSLPYLLLIALIVFVIVRVIMFIAKRQDKKREKRMAAMGGTQPYMAPYQGAYAQMPSGGQPTAPAPAQPVTTENKEKK